MFTRFESRVTIRGTLTAETALHLGTAGEMLGARSDAAVIRDNAGRPFIPGSSFKGVLRSRLEELIRPFAPRLTACPLLEQESPTDCVSSDKALKRELLRRLERASDEQIVDYLNRHTCDACKLFGTAWSQSKVLVRDLLLREPESWDPMYLEVRDGVMIERDSRTAAAQRKFDYEAVPAGFQFESQLVVENASPLELGLLFLALRQFEEGNVPLGGRSSRGLGWVRLTIDSIEVTDDTGELWGPLQERDEARLLHFLLHGRGYRLKGRTEDGVEAAASATADPMLEKLVAVVEQMTRGDPARAVVDTEVRPRLEQNGITEQVLRDTPWGSFDRLYDAAKEHGLLVVQSFVKKGKTRRRLSLPRLEEEGRAATEGPTEQEQFVQAMIAAVEARLTEEEEEDAPQAD